MNDISLIIPYYRNFWMLRKHVDVWEQYDPAVLKRLHIIVVDDGSPDMTAEEALRCMVRALPVELYRIKEDIPWNRGGARNLGAYVAKTPWLLHVDVDHTVPPETMAAAINIELDSERWYRFCRWRVGAADFTRKKDAADPAATFVEIHPHVDSYLITRELYWRAGGYDEDYSGSLGGGTPFLRDLTAIVEPRLLPASMPLHVHTTHSVPDASETVLSRDTSRYSEIRRRKNREKLPKAIPLNFTWERVPL